MSFTKYLLCAGLCALALGCTDDHDHGEGAHGEEAAHAEEEAHGHGHAPGAIAVTLWSERTELFMEYPPLVVGEEAEFLAHLTELRDFSPVTRGRLICTFQKADGTRVEVQSDQPTRPGIFIPKVTFREPGSYEMELRLEGPQVEDVLHVRTVIVYAAAEQVPHEEEAGGEEPISFLKEQQWKTAFSTAPARRHPLSASVQATGEILPRAQAHAEVPALVGGVIQADQNVDMPSIGTWVKKGQILAVISPPAETESTLMRIRNEYLLAQAEYQRTQRLFARQAIAEKRVEQARLYYQARKASYDRVAQQVDFSSDDSQPSLHYHVEAPIDGYVEEIHVHLGQTVTSGEKLFTVTNPERVWLKAQVPLTQYAHIGRVRDATFSVEGLERAFRVSALGGRVISVGNTIDRNTRTVPVIFEVDNPDHLLKINLFADVRVHTGEVVETLAIPSTALLDDEGTPVVYVQAEGEAFFKRPVQTGIVDGDLTQILSGLAEGEWVVTEGAYQVRLASMSSSVPTGHGHAH